MTEEKSKSAILTATGMALAIGAMGQHDHMYTPKPLPTKLTPKQVAEKMKKKAKRQLQRKARKIERMHRK